MEDMLQIAWDEISLSPERFPAPHFQPPWHSVVGWVSDQCTGGELLVNQISPPRENAVSHAREQMRGTKVVALVSRRFLVPPLSAEG